MREKDKTKRPRRIHKRDNSFVEFDEQKIKRAVFRAALEVIEDSKKASEIAESLQTPILKKIVY